MGKSRFPHRCPARRTRRHPQPSSPAGTGHLRPTSGVPSRGRTRHCSLLLGMVGDAREAEALNSSLDIDSTPLLRSNRYVHQLGRILHAHQAVRGVGRGHKFALRQRHCTCPRHVNATRTSNGGRMPEDAQNRVPQMILARELSEHLSRRLAVASVAFFVGTAAACRNRVVAG
jgi:hypothetical protein